MNSGRVVHSFTSLAYSASCGWEVPCADRTTATAAAADNRRMRLSFIGIPSLLLRHTRQREIHVLDLLPLPGVRNMQIAVSRLYHRWVRVLPRLAFEIDEPRPMLRVRADREIE